MVTSPGSLGLIRKIILIFLLFASIGAGIYYSYWQQKVEVTEKKEDIVIRAGGKAITSAGFEKRFAKENPYVKRDKSDEYYLQALKKAFAYKLADELILLEIARASGIDVTDSEIFQELDNIKEGYDKKSFDEMLKSEGLTVEKLRGYTRKRLTLKRVLNKRVFRDISVTVDEAKAFYNKYKSSFVKPREYKINRVSFQTEEEAKEALAKLKSRELDFEAITPKEHDPASVDPLGIGNVGYVPKSGLLQEFEEALDDLKIGDITDVIHTAYGYYILKLEALNKERIPEFGEVKDEITRRLREKKEKAVYGAFMKKYKDENEVVINDEYFKVNKNSN